MNQKSNKEIRTQGIRARDALQVYEREKKSEEICRRITETEEYRHAKTILIYKWIRGEVRLEALERDFSAKDKQLLYPLCISRTEMQALLPENETAWKKGSFGIMEPVAERSQLILPEAIDLVICPCSAFDEECRRVGMGGGFYDRFLPQCVNAHIMAVAFEAQKSGDICPSEWDVLMEKVITEDRIYVRKI